METKKIAYLLVFGLVLGSINFARGAEIQDTRFLVKSNSSFWKKSFGVRNQFDEGFTTDLADWQLRLAKVFSIDVVPVQRLYILQNGQDLVQNVLPPPKTDLITVSSPSPSKEPSVTPTPVASPTLIPSLRPTPSAQLPWGIKSVYGSDFVMTETAGGASVSVAVLDTGALKTHPDLKNRIVQCKDFTVVKKSLTDGQCEDKNGHGTHVAGIIAADGGGDGLGIYGVAPESNLFIYKVCDLSGSCWSDDVAMAIRMAADEGVNIINLSIGSDTESSLVKNAVAYAVGKNVLIVASAGNDGPDFGSIDYPAFDANVIAVSAFDVDFNVAEWSSRGINPGKDSKNIEDGEMEFSAPGDIIESTWKDDGYVILSGTSMSAPHVSGLAAKLWQKDAKDPDLATRELLRKFSNDLLPPGNDDSSGFGFPHL